MAIDKATNKMNKQEHTCGGTKVSYLGHYQYSDEHWDYTWGGNIYMVTTSRGSIFLEILTCWPQEGPGADIDLWSDEQRHRVVPKDRLSKCLSCIRTWGDETSHGENHKWGLLARVARKDLQK